MSESTAAEERWTEAGGLGTSDKLEDKNDFQLIYFHAMPIVIGTMLNVAKVGGVAATSVPAVPGPLTRTGHGQWTVDMDSGEGI